MTAMNKKESDFRRKLSKYDLVLRKRYGQDKYTVCDKYSNVLIAPANYYGNYSEMSLNEAVEWFEHWKNE